MRKKPQSVVDIDKLAEEIKDNIINDRACANSLLVNVMAEMLKNPAKSHEDLGFVAAKYIENLMRGNEQMLKLLATLSNKTTNGNVGISADVKEGIFDTLQEEFTKELAEKKKEEK